MKHLSNIFVIDYTQFSLHIIARHFKFWLLNMLHKMRDLCIRNKVVAIAKQEHIKCRSYLRQAMVIMKVNDITDIPETDLLLGGGQHLSESYSSHLYHILFLGSLLSIYSFQCQAD